LTLILPQVDQPPATRVELRAGPPERDGSYRPVAFTLAAGAVYLASPKSTERLYLIGAARRLDTAHRLISSARAAFDEADHSSASVEVDWRQVLDALSDLELGTIALYRAVRSCQCAPAKLGVAPPVAFPPFVEKHQEAIWKLRGAIEHVDGTALDVGNVPPETEAGVLDPVALFRNRRLAWDSWSVDADGSVKRETWSIGIDDEMEQVMLETRGYLVDVWNELASANRSA
jgi:hypothetical protein